MPPSSRTIACPIVTDPKRLAALAESGLPDTAPEEAFDRLTRFATRLLGVPVALVSLVDDRRQFFKSAVGLPEPWATQRETPLSHSFCQYVVSDRTPLVVEDARTDPRVAQNGAVRDLGVIAYAGVPLFAPNGQVLGAFCAIDGVPRAWSDDDLAILRELSDVAAAELRLRATVSRLDGENGRLEQAVQERTDQLRFASAAVADAARTERDRLARVLHDHLQQILVGAKMTLAAGGPVEDVAGFLDEAIAESRTLASELSPPVLRSDGLAPALTWLGTRSESRNGITVTVACDEALSTALPASTAATLYEFARELLLNVAKHAGGTSAAVIVDADSVSSGPAVRLTVTDDGGGFSLQPETEGPSDQDEGFGLSDLRQRVIAVGGRVASGNAPGGGGRVDVVLPLPRD
ncbi:GAF domain-containing sensor histidine kinase [Alienimonas chondri]|uniref:Histidine kinase domain-containing protein n=1 Tax=Alienimonas chondri TaxID=2681879 RepID=A0ABX1VDY5_9PLAN|nr:GAF domain-containing protein [Alienimonas chondri]NNJ26186.1 hypothetical protein [Alienimonas chondri]